MGAEQAFVGRAAELGQIAALVEPIRDGRGALLLFAGEAGIGKTALAGRAAALAEARGFRVAWGRSWEAGGAPAYFPWSQVFAALGLADPFAAGGAALDAREQRFRLFDEAARALAGAAAEVPIAIVLDDLHAADQASLGFLHRLARSVTRSRLLLLGTYRDAEARLTPEVAAVLAKIGREGDVIALERLGHDDVRAWLRATAPALSDADAETVCAAAEGNPLFVREIVRAHPRLDVRRLPAGLHAVIEEHIARVPDDTRALLASASVLGREIVAEDVAALAALDPDQVEHDLRAACDAGLLEPVTGHRDAFSFAHALVRDRLYAQLAASARAALHWRAGERLAATDRARAAHHLFEGRAAGEGARLAEVTRDAAQDALTRCAFEEAERLAARALDVDPGDPAILCELELVRAEALIRMGEGERGRSLCVQAAARARAHGLAGLAARAALIFGAEVVSGGLDSTMIRLLREALAGLDAAEDTALRARVMARLAAALTPPSPETLEEGLALARESMAIARRLGEPRTLLYCGYHALNAHYYRTPPDERAAIVDLVVAQATALDDRVALLQIASYQFASLRERGAHIEADRALDAFAAQLAALPSPQHQWRLPFLRATHALLAGDFVAAERFGDEGLAIAERCQSTIGPFAWAQHRVALAQARGEPASIAQVAERAVSFARRPRVASFVPWIHAAVGRIDLARELARELALDHAMVPANLVAADLAVLLDDRELAARVYPFLLPLCDLQIVFWGGPPCGVVIGPAARMAGDVAALLGRVDEARRWYDEAIAIADRIGAAPLAALARRGRDALGEAPPRPTAEVTSASLSRDGEHWTLAYAGRSTILKARRGLDHLARLLAEPGRELHVLELSAADADGERPRERGDAVLDAEAKAAYRAKLEALRDAAEDFEARGDAGRAERARAEIDAIAAELARALGLGGRDRTSATAADRARAAVTLAIRRAIDAIAEHEPDLAAHLAAAVKTGAFCSYRPEPRAALAWHVAGRSR